MLGDHRLLVMSPLIVAAGIVSPPPPSPPPATIPRLQVLLFGIYRLSHIRVLTLQTIIFSTNSRVRNIKISFYTKFPPANWVGSTTQIMYFFMLNCCCCSLTLMLISCCLILCCYSVALLLLFCCSYSAALLLLWCSADPLSLSSCLHNVYQGVSVLCKCFGRSQCPSRM